MNKIEEILQKHTGCEGTCECGCGLIKTMKEFGRLAFEAGRKGYDFFEIQKHPSLYNEHYYKTYEDFLKEIDAEGNM